MCVWAHVHRYVCVYQGADSFRCKQGQRPGNAFDYITFSYILDYTVWKRSHDIRHMKAGAARRILPPVFRFFVDVGKMFAIFFCNIDKYFIICMRWIAQYNENKMQQNNWAQAHKSLEQIYPTTAHIKYILLLRTFKCMMHGTFAAKTSVVVWFRCSANGR